MTVQNQAKPKQWQTFSYWQSPFKSQALNMKPFLLSLSMLALLLLAIPTAVRANEFIYIDVRSPQEFKQSHVKGALLMPYQQIDSLIKRSKIAKDAPIILYCKSGGRAGIAKKRLEALGYSHVMNAGGLRNLRAKQVPIESP